MASKHVLFSGYIRQDQADRLRELSKRTKVSASEYMRQGVDLVLAEFEAGNTTVGVPGTTPWYERDKETIQEALKWAAENPVGKAPVVTETPPPSDEGTSDGLS